MQSYWFLRSMVLWSGSWQICSLAGHVLATSRHGSGMLWDFFRSVAERTHKAQTEYEIRWVCQPEFLKQNQVLKCFEDVTQEHLIFALKAVSRRWCACHLRWFRTNLWACWVSDPVLRMQRREWMTQGVVSTKQISNSKSCGTFFGMLNSFGTFRVRIWEEYTARVWLIV